MYSKFQLARKFLSYYLSALNGKGHGMHSPFVFQFITEILNDNTPYPEYRKVERLRQELLKDHTMLTIEDFGAGSTISRTNHRSISSIAKNAAKPRKFGQLLFRIAKKYKPSVMLELGTSLGITSSYLTLGNPNGRLITLEGASAIAEQATANLKRLDIHNYALIPGDFDKTLNDVLADLSTVDLAFIDGNHRKEPTERYFNSLLPKMNNDSVLIFDDIHWSAGMEEAWQSIKQHPKVRCTVDLFFIGLVFFREEFKEKRDFMVRF